MAEYSVDRAIPLARDDDQLGAELIKKAGDLDKSTVEMITEGHGRGRLEHRSGTRGMAGQVLTLEMRGDGAVIRVDLYPKVSAIHSSGVLANDLDLINR